MSIRHHEFTKPEDIDPSRESTKPISDMALTPLDYEEPNNPIHKDNPSSHYQKFEDTNKRIYTLIGSGKELKIDRMYETLELVRKKAPVRYNSEEEAINATAEFVTHINQQDPNAQSGLETIAIGEKVIAAVILTATSRTHEEIQKNFLPGYDD